MIYYDLLGEQREGGGKRSGKEGSAFKNGETTEEEKGSQRENIFPPLLPFSPSFF